MTDNIDEPLQLERVYQEIKWRIVHARYGPAFVLSEGMLARADVRDVVRAVAAARGSRCGTPTDGRGAFPPDTEDDES